MCVTVHTAKAVTQPWDHLANAVTIPAGLSRERAITAVRAVLAELGATQPCGRAVCWCGARVME